MGWDESTTVSPGWISRRRCVPVESRPKIEDGSPCVPVHIRTAFDGGISFRTGGSWLGVHYGTLTANQWYYLAATYDGTTLRAYRNGTPVDQRTMGAPDVEDDTAKIGRHAFRDQVADHFDGLIDEVRVSSVARTSEWIRAQHRSMTDANFVSYGTEQLGNWMLP